MPQNPLAFVAINAAGAASPGFVDNQRALWHASRHARDYAAAAAGAIFMGANPSGVTTSVGLAPTCVGLILSNPAGSGKNLSLIKASGGFIVAPSIVTGINLITGYAAGGITAHTTPLTVASGLIGTGAAGVGLVDSAATLVGTPVWTRPLSETPVATTLPFFSEDINGQILIPPGGYAAIGTTIAGPASGFMGGFVWEEV